MAIVPPHNGACRIVERLLAAGRLKRPIIDDNGLWCASVDTTSGRVTAHGIDPIQCLANLHKIALPNVSIWR